MFAAFPDAAPARTPAGFGRVATNRAATNRPASNGVETAIAHPVGSPVPAHRLQVDSDAAIIGQGDAAEHCFQVVAGCVRTVTLLDDGRRHVGQFLFAGDLFGWETTGEHEFAVEAVTPVTLSRFRLCVLDHRAASDGAFADKLRQYIVGQLRSTREHTVLLGRKTAAERIASFLLEMQRRLRAPLNSVIDLPMSRTDMADYLGLTIETVCRGLAELRRHGTIGIERGRIVIHDLQALGHAGSDRLH